MSDSLKKRLEFLNALVQAQAVRSLVASVLKERQHNEKIAQSSNQSPALDALWEQCCSDEAVVRSACCDALVLLVEQGHADLQYVINSILNLVPSARNVQGLIKVLGKLLQIHVSQEQKDSGEAFTCPYSIRNPPHPHITVLENRPDCWPALLGEIDDLIKQAVDRDEPAYISVLAPFLRYLYCEPLRLQDHALLRQSLLRVLLPPPGGRGEGAGTGQARLRLLRCLCELVPHMQVDSGTAVLELGQFVEALLLGGGCGAGEEARLTLQLLCACQISLEISGECGPLLRLLQRLLPSSSAGSASQEFPLEQVIVGISLLLLKAPPSQTAALLALASQVVPPDVEAPPLVAPVLVLPLLHILTCSTLMEALTDPQIRSQNQRLAQSLLQTVQRPACPAHEDGVRLALPLSAWYSELLVATHALRRVSRDPRAACEWLHGVRSALPLGDRVPDHLPLILAHLIVTGQGDACRLALSTAALVAEADPARVPSLLPVLMFKLGRISDPALSHAVLYTLPNLGTHTFCVPQVLQTLQVLGSSPKLRAVAMRLMTALWEKQDRVYPELQKLMAQLEKSSVVVGKEDQWEQILARAACIRDICRERPYQHGGDMLAAITDTLTQCTKQDQATPSALVLRGLQELCRAEVVDIRSTWTALSPRLSCDSRPLVIRGVAELLALVPQLSVKTEEYEKFKEQVVSILWDYALSKDPEVACCGYKALSEFPEAVHTVLHLPEQARPPAKCPDSEEESKEEEEKEEDVSVPGSSYVKLVGLTPPAVLPALEGFLTSLVKQEMAVMPRGVYHSALRGGNLRSDQGKTVAGIPGFMLKTYEKNKQPGLKAGLAAGLLLCYDLPVQTDRDGRPINRFLVSRGRSFQQMLAALIHEVNIQPSEWHRSLLLPRAWLGFMSRAYLAVLQGRRAELEMQQKQGKDSPEELQYKQHSAWLWVRDQLTDVVKSAAKDSPVVQGNSILALSGLAAVLAKYESNLPADAEGAPEIGPEILASKHWLSMVLDTLLSVVSSSYRPRGQVFPWFQHRSYSGENTASAIARSCAALALSLVVPMLLTSHKDSVGEILSTLEAGLPGAAAADESQAVQFHTGLALGMVLSALQEERVSDVSGLKMTELLMSSQNALEACCFDTSLEYNTGCILGVGLVLSAQSQSGQAERRAHVALTVDRLLGALGDSAGQGRMLQEVLAYSVACAGVLAFSTGIINGSKAEEIMAVLRAMTEESQQTPGFALALGLTVHGLSSCGHGKAEDLNARLLAAWIKILLSEGAPTMQRLAAVNGLVALVGSESSLIQLKNESEQSSQQQARLNEVIRAVTQIITFSGVIGLQSNASCLAGHLHLAHLSSVHSRTTVPPDFGYLPERSVIRAVVDLLTEAGKRGPEFTHPRSVKVALEPLSAVGTSFQYPPINWSAVLSPLMRLNFGEEIQHLCIELVMSQSQSSQNASLFLGMWLSPPLVHSLSLRTRGRLHCSLSLWMKHVSEDKLQTFVEVLGVQQFNQENRPQRLPHCQDILEGLSHAMALPNPSQNCWAVLCSATEKIFALLPNHIQDSEVDLYVGIAKCLSEMTDTEIDRIAHVTEANLEKTGFIMAYLSSQGRIPLLGLNDVIATALRASQRERERISWLLLQSFYQSRLAANPNTGVLKRMEWLLELMGHVRNVAYGTTPVKSGDTRQATDFLLQVFSAAVLSWADHSLPLLLGVWARWFPWKQDSELPNVQHGLYGSASEELVSQCLLGLPCSIQLLLAKEPWKGQVQKFIDWLFSIAEGPKEGLSEASFITARAALLSLRYFPEFKKKGVWTRAYGW